MNLLPTHFNVTSRAHDPGLGAKHYEMPAALQVLPIGLNNFLRVHPSKYDGVRMHALEKLGGWQDPDAISRGIAVHLLWMVVDNVFDSIRQPELGDERRAAARGAIAGD